MKLSYSFIIPVFNRPEETRELLESFTQLEFEDDFEIVLIEDGSTNSSETVVENFNDQLNISYYFKENSGPGDSRNFGMRKAKGNYYIIFDSDCLVPPQYLKTVDKYLTESFVHCYGGADAAHESFTDLQKAINYVMTSFLTTGGIRGSENSISNFEPRSFNMGISREAFEATGGYGKIHPGEDPDLSQRIKKAGYITTFIENAFVYHKRRISWQKFYTQVQKFGLVRPILNSWHPSAARMTYWFPTLFVLYCIFSIAVLLLGDPIFCVLVLLYMGVLYIHSSFVNRSPLIGLLSVFAMFVQFFGYGLAFLKSSFYIGLLKKDPKKQFPTLFFK